MSHEKGNIRGAQHKVKGLMAKRRRQEAAWKRCKGHTFTGKHDRCKSCGCSKGQADKENLELV